MRSPSFPRRLRARRALAAFATLLLAGLTPVVTSGAATPAAAADDDGAAQAVAAPAPGYWMVSSDGGVFNYGAARFFGSAGAIKLNMPIVGMAATPSGGGYWLVASDGGLFAFGDARFFGSTGDMKLNKPIVGMAATPTGQGYWLVASDGGMFAFGDARFFGSTGDIKLNKPITGMSPSATGRGYRMVATDGGIFSYGDAVFFGSTGGKALAKPISGMAPTPSGGGYWLTAADGAVFPFGDARDLGRATTMRSVATMAPTSSGGGYWQVGADGALAAFGDAADLGHPSGTLRSPIVGMAVLPATAAPGNVGTPILSPAPGATAPATDPSTTTTVTAAPPFVSDLTRLYSSDALAGTVGTLPQLREDPSHPFRILCGGQAHQCTPTPSTANYAEEVRSMALVGNRLFVGGFFHGLVDSATGTPGGHTGTKITDTEYLVELDARTGKLAADQTFTRNASPDLTVESMAVDTARQRLYIGGRFANAGGGRAVNIAALDLRTGLLDPTFKPPFPNNSVHAVALTADRLYIGGSFVYDDKQSPAIEKVAALDANDGRLIRSFVPPKTSGSYLNRAGTPTAGEQGTVNALVIPAGDQIVLAGGEFVSVGTFDPNRYENHGAMMALNTSDGSLSPWRPLNDRPIFGFATSPDRRTIFAAAGGKGGAALALSPGVEKPLWTGYVDGDALGIAATRDRVYLGGHFDVEVENPNAGCMNPPPGTGTICGPAPPYKDNSGKTGDPSATPHRHLVAWDPNGKLDPTFTAQADTAEGPSVMLAGPDALYVAGNFFNTLDDYYKDQKHNTTFHPGFALFPAL